jgi:hypothetical protein
MFPNNILPTLRAVNTSYLEDEEQRRERSPS